LRENDWRHTGGPELAFIDGCWHGSSHVSALRVMHSPTAAMLAISARGRNENRAVEKWAWDCRVAFGWVKGAGSLRTQVPALQRAVRGGEKQPAESVGAQATTLSPRTASCSKRERFQVMSFSSMLTQLAQNSPVGM